MAIKERIKFVDIILIDYRHLLRSRLKDFHAGVNVLG